MLGRVYFSIRARTIKRHRVGPYWTHEGHARCIRAIYKLRYSRRKVHERAQLITPGSFKSCFIAVTLLSFQTSHFLTYLKLAAFAIP